MSDNHRLDQVEISLAHHEQKIEELSEVIEKQWKEIDVLKAKLRINERKIEELELASADGDDGPAANEKPPHY